ncbi:1802_t:CDS:2 [Rhizophagus irregularis]|nr:1802_t:CDS:2 [Rhizophagus irregularis]
MCKNNNSDPPVTVKVINDSIKFSKILSWKKNLSQIRSELEENNSIIDMELSLFVKISTSKDEGERLEVIDRDDENKRTLEEIMDTKKKVLYLQKYPWENFNEDHKLEHGYTITNNNVLIKANKKAFTITNCEIKKIVGKHKLKDVSKCLPYQFNAFLNASDILNWTLLTNEYLFNASRHNEVRLCTIVCIVTLFSLQFQICIQSFRVL